METPTPPSVERLIGHLFGTEPLSPSAEELRTWLTRSRRFRAFVESHRDKVRKKLRGATDDEARRDVRTELLVARLLLADRRMELAFEPLGSTSGGPDFEVSYRDHRAFTLEVTRRRPGSRSEADGGALLAKLRQLPPSVANVVLLAATDDRAAPLDVSAAIHGLLAHADAGDDRRFTERGFDGVRGFRQRFPRLGAVIAWYPERSGPARAELWTNPSARIAAPDRAVRAVLACLSTDEVS